MTIHNQVKEISLLLQSKGWSIAFAESMTAGMVVSSFASLPGISAVLMGGVIAYQPSVKNKLLGVPKDLLTKYTPESEEVCTAMVEGLQQITEADVCIAVTGLASPGGSASTTKPIGTTFVSFLIRYELKNYKKQFFGTRDQIRMEATQYIINILHKELSALIK
jgi:nicotinamide-nucleotide amidase